MARLRNGIRYQDIKTGGDFMAKRPSMMLGLFTSINQFLIIKKEALLIQLGTAYKILTPLEFPLSAV
jgi:hypothetical protein